MQRCEVRCAACLIEPSRNRKRLSKISVAQRHCLHPLPTPLRPCTPHTTSRQPLDNVGDGDEDSVKHKDLTTAAMFALLPGYRVASRAASSSWHSPVRICASLRFMSTAQEAAMKKENLNVGHSRFLAEGRSSTKWTENSMVPGNGGLDHAGEDLDVLPSEKGTCTLSLSHPLRWCHVTQCLIGFLKLHNPRHRDVWLIL